MKTKGKNLRKRMMAGNETVGRTSARVEYGRDKIVRTARRRLPPARDGRENPGGGPVERIRREGASLPVEAAMRLFGAGRFFPTRSGVVSRNPSISAFPNTGPLRNEFGRCTRIAHACSSSIPFSINGWITRSAEIGRPVVPPPAGGAMICREKARTGTIRLPDCVRGR